MPNKKKWTKKEINGFKKMIIGKRTQVLEEYAASKVRADEMLNNDTNNAIYSSHMADAGTDQQEMEKAYYWVARENKFLQFLNRALEMIEEGTFGVCKECGDLINAERLEEVPHTTSCFVCKNASKRH
jgi:RNA polymerase-binding transcription factor DksA